MAQWVHHEGLTHRTPSERSYHRATSCSIYLTSPENSQPSMSDNVALCFAQDVNVCISVSDRCTVLLVSVTTTTTRVRFPTRSTTTCGSSCVRFSSSETRLERNSSLYRSYRHCSTKITVRVQIIACCVRFSSLYRSYRHCSTKITVRYQIIA